MESMLDASSSDGEEVNLESNLVERISTEFNQLQFFVTKSKGQPLIEQVKPRMIRITMILQQNLEGLFLEGLSSEDEEMLRRCLRTYITIDKVAEAEDLFSRSQVKPYMKECISDAYIKQKGGSFAMYARILEFKNLKCSSLLNVLKKSSGREALKGFDFMVYSVWPEVVDLMENKAGGVFAPGNPDKFYSEYLDAMEFLTNYESQCGTIQSVNRLRAHPAYERFMSKWNLTVYFQIRLQEIASSVEKCYLTPWTKAEEESGYNFMLPQSALHNIKHCWEKGVFLHSLTHRFWKLTLQIIARYKTWLHHINTGLVEIEEVSDKTISSSRTTNNLRVEALKSDGRASPAGSSSGGSRSASPAQVVEYRKPKTSELILIVCDTLLLVNQIKSFYEADIVRLISPDADQRQSLDTSLEAGIATLQEELSSTFSLISDELISLCSAHLKQVCDIPRLYRRTNREVPSTPSSYALQVVQILAAFHGEQAKDVPKDIIYKITQPVIVELMKQYDVTASDVLLSVKKMEESLKRLKSRKTNSNLVGNMSDDDKIRLQISLDFEHLNTQITTLGFDLGTNESCKNLKLNIDEALSKSTD